MTPARFDIADTRAIRRAASLAALALLVVASLTGCAASDAPNTVKVDEPVSAEAVQATLTAGPAPVGEWPEKVGAFAATWGHESWYPAYLPDSFEVDSIDVVEFEPKTGLVCDIAFSDGEGVVVFTQGSATARDYEIRSVGKVAWGEVEADVVHEDPSDTTSPQMIVLRDGEGLAELSGSVGIDELKSVAESMMPVR